MSLLSQLEIKKGSSQSRKRVGRGLGSGLGRTSGRGHKGTKARSGGRIRRGFEGGQMPLQKRLPKVGFTNIFRKEFSIVNLDQLNQLKDEEVTTESLRKLGLVSQKKPVKVLAGGTLERAITVKVERCSEAAKKAIEAAGGKVEVMDQCQR